MVGTLLALLFPGLGQFYYGKPLRGSMMLLLGVTPLYPIALLWSVVDAYRLHRRGVSPVYDRREAAWAIVIVMVVVPLGLGTAGILVLRTFSWYRATHLNVSATAAEMQQIALALDESKEASGRYPHHLRDLAAGRPLRMDWLTDAWGRPFRYETGPGDLTFTLTSVGRDGILGTADDMSIASPRQP